MIEARNPFSDPEIKNQILGHEGRPGVAAEEDYELLQPETPASVLDKVLSSAPKIPAKARNMILDASAVANSVTEQKALAMRNSLNEVFSKYNEAYGGDLQIDFGNLSNTLVAVSDPEKRQVLELYVSEVFKSIKPILLLKLITNLSLAIEYISDPTRLFSGELSVPDIFLVVEKFQSYIVTMEEYMPGVTIENSDRILKKLAEEKQDSSISSPESQKAVDDFLALFKKDSGIGEV